MIVRAVHVHERFTDGRESGERGRGTIDELAIRAAGGKISFQYELVFFTRLQSIFFEKTF